MAKNPLIQIQNLAKSYTTGGACLSVLQDISLTVHQGESLAIVGSSGSGKSTLMSIIGLLDTDYQGDYHLNQCLVKLLSEDAKADLRNQMLGFVFQNFHLLPRFTAAQNVALPLLYRPMSKKEREESVMACLSRVGMSRYSKHKPNQLSGGQQQRIAIARALVVEPLVLLADEPTGALDSETATTILELVLSLAEEGKTIILITHDKEVAAACKRQICIKDGQVSC